MKNLIRMVKNNVALALVVLLIAHLILDRSYPITPFWLVGWMMIPGVVMILVSAVLLAESLRKPHEKKTRTVVRVVIGVVFAILALFLPFDIWGAVVSAILLVAGWRTQDTPKADSRHLTVWLALVLFLVFGWYYLGALLIYNIFSILNVVIVAATAVFFVLQVTFHIMSREKPAHGSHTPHP